MFKQFLNDENGAVLSAELVLIMTILVIGMIVGLAELQDAVVNELNDVGEAVGSLNQSFFYHGHSGRNHRGFKSATFGAFFFDRRDNCDGNECMISCDRPIPEFPKQCAY